MKYRITYGLLSALFMWLYWLTWKGAVVFIIILAVFLLVYLLTTRFRHHPYYGLGTCLCALILFIFLIALALMTFVFPVFNEVLGEMSEGLSPPAATRILMRATEFIAYGFGWLIGIIFLLITLVVWTVSIRIKFRPRQPDKPYLLSRIFDFIKWHLPNALIAWQVG